MPPRTARSDRGRLNRERILRAALEYADANGVESLKMRELAQTLGFEAMALYRHVAGKDEILDGIMDLVLAETEPADRKSTRLNSSHLGSSYAVFGLTKK